MLNSHFRVLTNYPALLFQSELICPFQSSIRMQSFRVPQVLCHHSLSQAVFPSNKTDKQGTGGRWRLSQGEELGVLQKERDIAHHLSNLNQQVLSEIVGSRLFYRNIPAGESALQHF